MCAHEIYVFPHRIKNRFFPGLDQRKDDILKIANLIGGLGREIFGVKPLLICWRLGDDEIFPSSSFGTEQWGIKQCLQFHGYLERGM